ncbi:MAG: AraC family transcriptional regulator [Clostridia bacterium]|nr:AraC family transcriptional regulator [Clostridia bacterium]
MKQAFECPRLLIRNRQDAKENLSIRKKKLKNYNLHWHDCFEIELILSGSAVHELNGKTYNLTPGDIYLLNPTDFHRVKSDGAEVFNIMFSENLLDDELLQKILNVENNIAFHLNKTEFENATALISQMLTEFRNGEDYSEAYIKNLLECLFIILLRRSTFKQQPESDEKTIGVRKALLYIHSHFRDNPTMAEAAKISGFNKNYFSSLFHKTTGQTYKNYLSLLKLEHAKKLVLSSKISVTEICFASGFNSLPNFLRSFKAHFGISPGAMRKNHNPKNE